MPDNHTIMTILNTAIQEQTTVYIRYRDYHGNLTNRMISPIEWAESDKVLAFCHERKAERHFKVQNIVDISREPLQASTNPLPGRPAQDVDAIPRPRVVPAPAPSAQKPPAQPSTFSKVATIENWQALLSYYSDCLNYEYQHQFSFDKQGLFILNINRSDAYSFLSQKNYLEYKYAQMNESFRNFLDPKMNKNKQLCFGKSFVRLSSEKITPLLFVPVNMDKKNPDRLILRQEELCLSYACLLNLNFSSEEVGDFIQEYENYLNTEPSLENIEKFVIQALSNRLTRPLPIFSQEDYSIDAISDYSIFDGCGFFWADNRFTGNLIKELSDLKRTNSWLEIPKIIPGLLNQMPEHHHEPAPDFIQDQKFYVTDINTQQRKAAQAVAQHPVTIITGPPGTGKSQLVLNLIAQAYLQGQTVLFASHNNKAVDVVMDRLQGEINFQGAIRTGTKENRTRAVEQMENALSQIHKPDISGYQQKYQQGKIALKNAHDTLHQVRDLLGKLQSYQTEKEELLARIPFGWRENFNQMRFPFNESEKTRVLEVLSELSENFRLLIHQRNHLNDRLREFFQNKDNQASCLRIFMEYELRWGLFANGLLHRDHFDSLHAIQDHCILWRNILDALTAKKNLDDAIRAHRAIKQQIESNSSQLDDQQNGVVLEISEKSSGEILTYQQQLETLHQELEKIKNNQFTWFQKLLHALRLVNPRKQWQEQMLKLVQEIGFLSKLAVTSTMDLDAFSGELQQIDLIVATGELLQKEKTGQDRITELTGQQTTLYQSLPAEIVTEFDRLNLADLSIDDLRSTLLEIEQQAQNAEKELVTLLNKAISFFIKNEEFLSIIPSIQQLDEISLVKGSFGLALDISEGQALDWAQLWRMAIVLWEVNSVINHSRSQLANLPTEEQAFATYQQASQSLFQVAGDLMRATWFNRAADTPNDTFAGTEQYISAVKHLNDLEYGQDGGIYSILKGQEQRNFPHAIKMFPIWAITNLTARSNFPLSAALFDLVIIDEASQCDIPSVIPLLFRAKKIVIIGDPNQLRHVASLNQKLNQQIGNKYGVGLEAYSYTTLSLYDLGERSVGLHPGAILLDEHYRSDPRIITFSNEEFYGSQLVIKTDLSRRGYSKEFLNTRGGVSWLHVDGKYERSQNGASENLAEFNQIQQLVPKVLKALDEHGYKKATVGIVTPFRGQENLLRKWLQSHPNSNRLRSGTAHQFQGDECDVMIFSPVLSEGIQEGTLNWLENTANLLNVAITRARVSLIIVGDLEFCLHQLPARSKYHRLASYVKDRLGQSYSSMHDLPLLNGKKFEIVGTIVDPSNPEHNRTTLTRFISSCQEFVYWVDPYFSSEIIDLFDEIYEKEPYPRFKTIRLLTAERQIKYYNGKPPAIRPESIESLMEFLEEKGVDFEMRVLPGDNLPHDRLLYHQGGAVNMPPFAGAYGVHRHLSEYTHSVTTVETFHEYWEKAIPVIE